MVVAWIKRGHLNSRTIGDSQNSVRFLNKEFAISYHEISYGGRVPKGSVESSDAATNYLYVANGSSLYLSSKKIIKKLKSAGFYL